MREELEESHQLRQTGQIIITKKLRIKCCVELPCRDAVHSEMLSPFRKQGQDLYRHMLFIDYGLKLSDSEELTYRN